MLFNCTSTRGGLNPLNASSRASADHPRTSGLGEPTGKKGPIAV